MLALIMDSLFRMDYPRAAHYALACGPKRHREPGAVGFQLADNNMNEHASHQALSLNLLYI
jgi:hypothetical protein